MQSIEWPYNSYYNLVRARCLIAFLATAACCCAQVAGISAPDQVLYPGQTAVVPLVLASGGSAIAAVQFDVQWDSPLSFQFTAGDQLRAASKLPYVGSGAARSLRCLIVGMNQAAIADGELLKLFVSVDPAASAGLARVSITNVVASDPTGTAVAVTASAVNIQIQSGTSPLPSLASAAVLNAGSLTSGPVSPGEIITLLGWYSLPMISLRIGNLPAPVLYASSSQINAIVPYALDANSSATFRLQNTNQTLTGAIPVAAATPAIFTSSGAGVGPGAILNQDYTPNSFDNPAQPGSIVMVYGTGFGVLQSPVTDGQIIAGANPTASPVSATVAGIPSEVLYAGSAPGLIGGVTQINIQLPAGISHNPVAPLMLRISGTSTPPGTTVAIQ